MSTAALDPLVGVKADFPGLLNPDGSPWHYLDSAATAQKPRVVIDAVAKALGEDYATVHRGVYTRSAEMTLGYEAALTPCPPEPLRRHRAAFPAPPRPPARRTHRR